MILGVMVLLGLTLVAVPSAHARAAQCTGSGVKVETSPATVQVRDTTTGALVSVVVTLSGDHFDVEAVDPSIDISGADWCLKAGTQVFNDVSGELPGYSGNGKDVSNVLLVSVTTEKPQAPVCTQTWTELRGSDSTMHELGVSGGTSMWMTYWGNIVAPGAIEIYYEGQRIFTSGPFTEPGTFHIAVPDGEATAVEMRVTAPEGSNWAYIAKCPGFTW